MTAQPRTCTLTLHGVLVYGPDVRQAIDDLRGDLTDVQIERLAGISKGQMANVIRKRRDWITYDLADKILSVALGRPDRLLACRIEEATPHAA